MDDRTLRILAALSFGISSFLITIVNKIVLTTYNFPSIEFIAFGQMLITILILTIAKLLSIIDFPSFSHEIPGKIFPLPLFYAINMLSGLGGTKAISLPMFTVLRRFSILLTMILEFFIIGIIPSKINMLCVFLMIFGAFVAGINDLSFDLKGYSFIMINNAATAGNGVYTKKKLNAKDLGKFGLLYYNCLFMIIPITLFMWYIGGWSKAMRYHNWSNLLFLIWLSLSMIMGFVLMYSIMICTEYNSALTTTVIGVIKNFLVTYLGMVIGGDYRFSILNFVGINISGFASIIYSYATFRKTKVNGSPPHEKSNGNAEKVKTNGLTEHEDANTAVHKNSNRLTFVT